MLRYLLFIFVLFSFSVFSQDIVINEICTKNNNILTDDDYNQFSDWIELFNNESYDVDISGYFITDDTLNKTKWQFPSNSILGAGDYIIIWADDKDTLIDNFHTNFKLSSISEDIALYTSETNLIDLLVYPDQLEDISYGKTISGLAYFSTPTPDGPNITTAYYTDEREGDPLFYLPSGFYNENSELSISGFSPDALVRYTTDGSYPSENAALYTDPILLTENTVIRARTYGNALPSKEVSSSYFIDTNKELPFVSLIINPDFLWSDSLGIFNEFEINKRIEWERFSKIQYFDDEILKFETNNDIRLFGATAYLLPQKSFAVFANSEIQYQIFSGKELSVFDSFILRSSSDDWKRTMFRDGFIQSIVGEKLNIDYQAYQPTVLYINGEYYGIFNLREKYNEDYLKNIHGINKDSIDLLNLNYWGLNVEVVAGSEEKYFDMLYYLNTNDMTDDEVFEGVSEYLDVDNYTTYIISQIYTANRSYKHNIKTWRENGIVDGFKWLLFDTDRAYSDTGPQTFLMIYNADPVLKRLLENINYRNHFLQQTCSHINATFRYDYVNQLVDSLKGKIESEMPFHIEKWAPLGGVQSMDSWNNAVYIIKDFALKRKDSLLHRLDSMYNLSGQVAVHLKIESLKGGEVYIEDVLIPYHDLTHTYFKDVPLKLVAKPQLGYRFIEWENISTNDSIIRVFNDDETITARFEPECDIPQLIIEDAILLKDCSPYHFESDIAVAAGATLFCEPGVEIFFGNSVQLEVYGNIEFIGTENDPVVIQGEPGNYWKYIKSDNGNVHLKNVHLYSGEKAISFANGGSLLIENCTFYESGLNTNDFISGNGAHVVFSDNVFYGNEDNTKRDCIDCKSIPFGEFTGNIFYDVTDDCIDIGNNSSEISIRENEAYNCKSMAISIGESTIADISRNIIVNCMGAIQVHTDAMATIINNTLYNNEIGIRCYHNDDTPNSGGSAVVVNTIFSQCVEEYTLQENSQIDITYSLSDKTLHSGTGNIFDDPLFVNPLNYDFSLTANSPCIDAGDILSNPDPDGSRADMGALYFDHNNYIPEFSNYISVYPNPFNEKFTIRIDSSTLIQQVNMYNLLGENVYSRENIKSDKCVIETKSKGLLFIVVSDNNGEKHSFKLISN